ncbi:MAG: D-inositol-3-phosphate glycosyltransferase [bacterium ADurb.Bin429]|nr:MAG: D-inositol-3-phosphate glycosyltransferase [bacterium ADurb.Bin429]
MLFKGSKPSRLAACLNRLIEDASLRRQLGERGAVVARERFTWTRAQEALLACYARLFSSTPRYNESNCATSVSGE